MEKAAVLLHGFGAGRWMMAPLAGTLRRAGYAIVNVGYGSRGWPLDRIVAAVDTAASPLHSTHRISVVGHSMGGLVGRAWLAATPPPALGGLVMLGPPNGGSEWVSMLARLRMDRLTFRHARTLLQIDRPAALGKRLGVPDYPVGVIAGDRAIDPIFPALFMPKPNDGKVSVAATHLEGQADHIVLPVPHALMPYSKLIHRQVVAFLQRGRFDRA